MTDLKTRAVNALTQGTDFAVDWQSLGADLMNDAMLDGHPLAALGQVGSLLNEAAKAPIKLTLTVQRDADGLIGAVRHFDLASNHIVLVLYGCASALACTVVHGISDGELNLARRAA